MSAHDDVMKQIEAKIKKTKELKQKASEVKDAQYHVFKFFKEVDEINDMKMDTDPREIISTQGKPNFLLYTLAWSNLFENIAKLDKRCEVEVIRNEEGEVGNNFYLVDRVQIKWSNYFVNKTKSSEELNISMQDYLLNFV